MEWKSTMETCRLLRSRSRSQRVTEKKAEGWAVTIREKISSVSFIPLFSIFSFIFSNEWDIWNAEISRISLFIFLPRSGLFVYPKFQPPWDNSTGPTLFQNFTVWGSAGGAQVCFFNFFKVRNVIYFLVVIYSASLLKGRWFVSGGGLLYYHSFKEPTAS